MWVVFRPTNDCTLISVSSDHPPSTSMMMLYWCTSYPLYFSFNSHLSGPYFIVFSSLLFSLLLILGQLICMVMTFLLTWFTTLASTRLARTSWWSAYTGTLLLSLLLLWHCFLEMGIHSGYTGVYSLLNCNFHRKCNIPKYGRFLILIIILIFRLVVTLMNSSRKKLQAIHPHFWHLTLWTKSRVKKTQANSSLS